jgi:CRISPR-associated Csx14 family protein
VTKTILLAALGDHPAVVSGMVKALRELADLDIDVVHVVHTENADAYIGADGVRLIREQLQGQCEVHALPLGFPDLNTYPRSLTYMQKVADLLADYEDPAQYRVYLSLAGGRKNMAALMALVAQFFPAVRGLYHLLDRREGTSEAVFCSAEEMATAMSEAQVRAAMDPPLEALKLVPVPYPEPFADRTESLRQFVKDPDRAASPPVPLSPEAEQFYWNIFHPEAPTSRPEVWLTETAHGRFCEWAAQGDPDTDALLTCLQEMGDPFRLRERAVPVTLPDDGDRDAKAFYVYQRPDTQVRPVFYTEPHPIDAGTEEPIAKVIVCGVSVETADGEYEPPPEVWFQTAARTPMTPLPALMSRERVLVVPLGESPMIATQTYVLLRERAEEDNPEVPVVALVHPGRSGPIKRGVTWLKTLFADRGVTVRPYPIRRLRDIDTEEKCRQYLTAVLAAIEELREAYPDREIVLSLSGGRKGMSVLTLFAAQRAGVPYLYHTLIQDPDLEDRVEQETDYETLRELGPGEQRARRLFLEEYGQEHFRLFRVPVIPVTAPEDA